MALSEKACDNVSTKNLLDPALVRDALSREISGEAGMDEILRVPYRIGTTLLRSMGHGDITTHGFRASFRTWASECTLYPREVCELALAHDERSQTEDAYSRSNLVEKRRELMQDWADYATTPTTANVVQGAFRKKESA